MSEHESIAASALAKRALELNPIFFEFQGTKFRGLYCDSCGVKFAVDEWWFQDRMRLNATFVCPNGCAGRRAYRTQHDVRLEP